MKKKVLCTALATMMLLSTTASAEPWWLSKYRVTFDNELGMVGNVTVWGRGSFCYKTIDLF